MRRIPVLAAAVATALTACAPGSSGPPLGLPPDGGLLAAAELTRFEDCGDLVGHLRSEALARVTAGGLPGGGDHGLAVAEEAVAAPAGADASTSAPGPASRAGSGPAGPYSRSNLQEAGVEEPDLAKSDGRRIVSVVDGRLRIIDVTGDRPRVVATDPLEGLSGPRLLLHGQRVLVLGQGHDEVEPPGEPDRDASDVMILPTRHPVTVLRLFDLSGGIAQVAELEVEGRLLTAREAGGLVRAVITSGPPRLDGPAGGPARAVPERRDPVGEDGALRSARTAIRRSTLADWLPGFAHAGAGGVTEEGRLLACDRVYRPAEFDGLGTLSVLTLDPTQDDLNPEDTAGVVSGGQTVYASPERLYVATTSQAPAGRPVPGPLPAPEPLPEPEIVPESEVLPAPGPAPQTGEAVAVPGSRPSPGEARPGTPPPGSTTTETEAPAPLPPETVAPGSAVPDVVEPGSPVADPPTVTTAVHAFDITGTRARYIGSGEVGGRLLNQFSLSEHDGFLRVATTRGQPWDGTSDSAVTILAERGGGLVRVGQVGGLGRGERIYAVRFLGEVGYVVTFRQVDPLYTLDLSDPTTPRVTGELKILGYSAYLHPLGDGLLLGVGQDATAEGRTRGTQLSLFDVSDPARPTRLAQATVADGHSEVESDHLAFLYWPPERLAVLPVMAHRPDGFFAGALAFEVGRQQVRRVGEIVHDAPGAHPQGAGIRRAIVVGDGLYTLSDRGIGENDLSTLEHRAFVAF